MIKFSALVCLCHEKIYRLRSSSPLRLLLANFGFLGYKHGVAASWNYEVRARSSAGERSLTSRGHWFNPVVPTSIYFKLWILGVTVPAVFYPLR